MEECCERGVDGEMLEKLDIKVGMESAEALQQFLLENAWIGNCSDIMEALHRSS